MRAGALGGRLWCVCVCSKNVILRLRRHFEIQSNTVKLTYSHLLKNTLQECSSPVIEGHGQG